jgi:TolB-like protein/Flp pilus assembly protein TadD
MGEPDKNVPHPGEVPREAEAGVAAARLVTRKPPLGEPVWARIRRHKIVEWTLAYVAFGYALLHGVQMLRETFEWPLLVSRLTVFGLVLGTPLAVTLAWYHGHRARHRISGPELSMLIALLVVAGSVLWWISRHSQERAAAPTMAASTTPAALAAAFNPPPHSLAVLPFVNMSGDASQEYFSDGLTEELLNSLSRINELQVAARTSSFSFQGEHPDIATVARKLNVASVLEGSVRRSGHTIRVTAQLNNAVTGFHIWSQTYDRDLGDVLQLQAEIATAVTDALKVTLLGDLSAKIELGGTRNPAAFDAYLRGLKLARAPAADSASTLASIGAYSEAVRLDPNYAIAFAGRGYTLGTYAGFFATGRAVRETWDRALADAQKAISIAPGLGDGHMVLGAVYLYGSFNFASANKELERAVALAPGNAVVLYEYARLAAYLGHIDAAVTAARRGATLDPLNLRTHRELGDMLLYARRYTEAVAAYQESITLDPEGALRDYAKQGVAYYLLGDLRAARTSCETKPDQLTSQLCLALVLHKLGQLPEARSALAKAIALNGEAPAYQCAEVYAQWADPPEALSWLETSLRRHDSGLPKLRVDPLLDPVRNEPRFQAVERELKFPQ